MFDWLDHAQVAYAEYREDIENDPEDAVDEEISNWDYD